MTTINRSMYPLQQGLSNVIKMQARYTDLQIQLSSGKKANTLAEMGSSRFSDLNIRSRLGKIDNYQDSITSVNLRLTAFDNTLTRLDSIESETRTGMLPTDYGTDDVNLTTVTTLSKARLDEVLTLLNSDVAGRYLFGGSTTDEAPVETTSAILDGVGGKAGFRTVAMQRKLADLGSDGLGRLDLVTASDTVTLSEDGTHPFGFKLSTIVSTSSDVVATGPSGMPQSLSVQFTDVPDAGSTVTLGLTLPGGAEEQITLTAVTGTPGDGEFQIAAAAAGTVTATGASLATATSTLTINGENFAVNSGDDAATVAATINASAVSVTASVDGNGALVITGVTDTTNVDVTATVAGLGIAIATYSATTAAENTAANFGAALESSIQTMASTELSAASTFAAADNFFNGSGESVMRVNGPPYETATALVAATSSNTVLWYSGSDAAAKDVAAEKTTGDLSALAATGGTITINGENVTLAAGATQADVLTALQAAATASGTFTVTGGVSTISLASVDGGDLVFAGDSTTLSELGLTTETISGAPGSARQSVTAKIGGSTTVAYGVEANEEGLVQLVRTLAALSVETYSTSDDTAKGRYTAMATRQFERLSESNNSTAGSIEVISVELGVVAATVGEVKERHTTYEGQLETMLAAIEEATVEEVAMEMLALRTRLEASYQAIATISQMSLVNYLP